LRYDRIARLYDILDLPFEHGRYKPLRRNLFEGLSGRILDAGVGTGRNMPFYPRGTRVIGFDISSAMLRRAAARRVALGIDAPLVLMDVCTAGFPDQTFDAVVATFLFCVLPPDLQLPALRELRRICRSGGEVRILEYAYSQHPVRRFVMHLWAPWVRLVYGAAFDRETERYIPDAGLELVEERFLYSDIIKLLIARPR
jgi:ubiquinone/menaquinone biosynthesis C-methylase UbiE